MTPGKFWVRPEMCYSPQETFLTDVSSHPPLSSASIRVDAATADFQPRSYRTWLEAGGVHRFFLGFFWQEDHYVDYFLANAG